MAMQYKTKFYGGDKGIDVEKANIAMIGQEVGKYLDGKGLQAQGIKLPGLNDALKLVSEAVKALKKAKGSSNVKDLGFTPELKVVGGLDAKGNLSATVTGLLPPKKAGGKPEAYDETAVIRKDWAKLEAELAKDKNAVVNLTKDWSKIEPLLAKLAEKHKGDLKAMAKDKAFISLIETYKDGDAVINKAAANQAKKFQADEKRTDEADFGGLTSGTVVLAAHGSRGDTPSGKVIGTKLGKKSPQEIVALLTENKDKKKNLSKKFNGTILLSGCFTAAGGIAPNDDYDYAPFAQKVWNLLKAKGINCKVSGMPGQARTDAKGDKSSVKPTEQAAYDKAKKEYNELLAAFKKLEPQLKAKDPKVVAVVNKKMKALVPKLNKLHAEKEEKVMKKLIMNYGLDPVR